jgi:hypothetical protein
VHVQWTSSAVIKGNLSLRPNELRRVQLSKDFRFSKERIGSWYGDRVASRRSVSAKFTAYKGPSQDAG